MPAKEKGGCVVVFAQESGAPQAHGEVRAESTVDIRVTIEGTPLVKVVEVGVTGRGAVHIELNTL
jgi:hypothetical protein